jgi:hypothetical protein
VISFSERVTDGSRVHRISEAEFGSVIVDTAMLLDEPVRTSAHVWSPSRRFSLIPCKYAGASD